MDAPSQFIGSTNLRGKGVLYFKDDSGSMLAYSRLVSRGGESGGSDGPSRRDLGRWSEIAQMTAGMPGVARYSFCTHFGGGGGRESRQILQRH